MAQFDLTYFESDKCDYLANLMSNTNRRTCFNDFESINYNSGQYPLFSWALNIWLPGQPDGATDGATEMERVIVS